LRLASFSLLKVVNLERLLLRLRLEAALYARLKPRKERVVAEALPQLALLSCTATTVQPPAEGPAA
jgi:hypothetical protein